MRRPRRTRADEQCGREREKKKEKEEEEEEEDQFWGDRSGTFTNPFGYQWTMATARRDLSREEMDRRAQEFFKQFAQQSQRA